MSVHVTQIPISVLFLGDINADVTQVQSSVILEPDVNAMITQIQTSVMTAESVMSVTQIQASALFEPDVSALVTQLQTSVLISLIVPPRTTGITVDVEREKPSTQHRPLSVSFSVSDKNGNWLFNIERPDSYSHSIQASGGFYSASLGIKATSTDMNDWIENGLARQITVYFDGVPVWEGFVNGVSINFGALTYKVGPLMDIGNRVWVTYAPLDTTVTPPVAGDTTESTIAENIPSQLSYGIIEKIMDVGQVTDEDAERYRDTWLSEYSMPKSSKDISLGGGDTSISIELIGFGAWLEAYMYSNASELFTTASEKIRAVLAANPNTNIFSIDYGLIDYNAYLVQEASLERNKTAQSVIDEIVPLGDANNNRWIFGVTDNRRVYYKAIPTTVDYYQRLSDPSQTIYDKGGNIVYPWMVRPGKWLYLLDFLAGGSIPADLKEDPRAIFIEEVSFDMPWGLSIRGGMIKNLDQLLAQKNMTG